MNVQQRITFGSSATGVSASSRTTREELVGDPVHEVVNTEELLVVYVDGSMRMEINRLDGYFEDW